MNHVTRVSPDLLSDTEYVDSWNVDIIADRRVYELWVNSQNRSFVPYSEGESSQRVTHT